MYQNEILQETCYRYLLWEDHQLFLVTLKVGCINEDISDEIISTHCGFWCQP